MAPIDGDLNVTRENAGELLKRDEFKNLTTKELMILTDAKSEADKKKGKESLLNINKPNMTSIDKENIQKSITYLEKNGIDTPENLKKLEAINYGLNYIEIGGVKFSREKLVPQSQFNQNPNQYGVFESDKKGVFKTMYNGKDEYYLTSDAYIDESKKQGRKAITDDHIRKALQALPGEFSQNNRYQGANILGNMLNLSMSGYISDGQLCSEQSYGYIYSLSHVKPGDARLFEFDERRGRLMNMEAYGFKAHPCLFVVE